MDPIVLVIIVAVGAPVGVLLGLAYAARLRGPARPRETRRPVRSLVTEAVPEERERDADAADDESPVFSIDSAPPDSDPGPREPRGSS